MLGVYPTLAAALGATENGYRQINGAFAGLYTIFACVFLAQTVIAGLGRKHPPYRLKLWARLAAFVFCLVAIGQHGGLVTYYTASDPDVKKQAYRAASGALYSLPFFSSVVAFFTLSLPGQPWTCQRYAAWALFGGPLVLLSFIVGGLYTTYDPLLGKQDASTTKICSTSGVDIRVPTYQLGTGATCFVLWFGICFTVLFTALCPCGRRKPLGFGPTTIAGIGAALVYLGYPASVLALVDVLCTDTVLPDQSAVDSVVYAAPGVPQLMGLLVLAIGLGLLPDANAGDDGDEGGYAEELPLSSDGYRGGGYGAYESASSDRYGLRGAGGSMFARAAPPYSSSVYQGAATRL